MDIFTSKQHTRLYVYSKFNQHRYDDGQGDDNTLDSLEELHNHNDPLTILLNEEERLTRRKHYASFQELSKDLNLTINKAI